MEPYSPQDRDEQMQGDSRVHLSKSVKKVHLWLVASPRAGSSARRSSGRSPGIVESQVDIEQPMDVVLKGQKAMRKKTSDRKMETSKAIEKQEEEEAVVGKTQDEEEVVDRKDSGTVVTTTAL
ncbi:hypothetical protein L596_010519 [Steinernema carpocapsae]|uniref:Uncharacterized protein n=1 Tax=Steinernema carpocapsae TaxID=34508 RepID=A0A4U5PJY6_STECR|nr:hypothetical protein L596_010519 [Steinernema carpocapsae]